MCCPPADEVPDAPREPTSDRLTEAREFLGLPVSAVAEAMQFGLSEVADLEAGRREPTEQELERLSVLYHRPVWWLTGGPRRTVGFDQRLSDQFAGLSEQDRDAVVGFAEFLADAGPPGMPRA